LYIGYFNLNILISHFPLPSYLHANLICFKMPETPPYQIRFEDRETYLYASVTGEKDSLEVSVAYWTDVFTEMRIRNTNKVLVTEDFKDVVSAMDMYMLIEEIQKLGLTDLQIAFVDKELSQFELNKFAETVAVNRGIYGKIFNSEAEAERWLLSNK
jgi:hypothetical protein